MDSLERAREEIDKIDSEMAQLFVRRMQEAEKIAAYKRENGLPCLDAAREREVIAKNAQRIADERLRAQYTVFLRSLMDISKNYQRILLEGRRVAYSGVEGAFAHIAADRIFPDAQKVSYPDFQSAYEAVQTGLCDYCVLPIENSYAGEVGQVSDLMYQSDLVVNGIYILPIKQCLLGVAGASVESIKSVKSHPQALSQCEGYIKKHGFSQVYASNTALAAQSVAQEGDLSIAAIASEETAELYGLSVIDHDINDDAMNTTRFAVFSRADAPCLSRAEDSFILLFTVRHQSGSLVKALNVIGKYRFNMKSLRSRPVKGQAWNYYFYVEIEGDATTQEGEAMLAELGAQCSVLKVIGHYASDVILQKGEKTHE